MISETVYIFAAFARRRFELQLPPRIAQHKREVQACERIGCAIAARRTRRPHGDGFDVTSGVGTECESHSFAGSVVSATLHAYGAGRHEREGHMWFRAWSIIAALGAIVVAVDPVEAREWRGCAADIVVL